MKRHKIRGIRRRHRTINVWLNNNLLLKYGLLEKYGEDHCDLLVHPWCDVSVINSTIPQPKRETRNLMVSGLIKIYYNWKEQLDKLKKPYYLKIWLYYPRFELSRVVCAIGERKIFYENSLNEAHEAELPANLLSNSYSILNSFSWKLGLDNDYYSNNDLGEEKNYASSQDYLESRRWFAKILAKPHITIPFNDSEGNILDVYCFKRGNIWIGTVDK
ncbi:hypothetical protein H8B15_18175 [Hymenobacter sp. BT507]|uniref:Uncharacterized protein n=1 Tax=Hymenobacter citatus TaxID=2763506 RepID=A0ABR7MP42_9BACT|nr:hypothetical protein [Hymenobacter citatus]MBC6612857.1 hypothetical protein [Hymenobacter citatus]